MKNTGNPHNRTTHGRTYTPEYKAWNNMLQRCQNPNIPGYENYGGRGISVSPEWTGSFEAFLGDMGPRPGPEYSLEREDTNGNYVPGNCRWATRTEQNNNKRDSVRVQYQGESLTLKQLAERTGAPFDPMRKRISKGMSPEEAVSKPFKKYQTRQD